MLNRDISFSLWLDFIERDFLNNEFVELINRGIINGATSNPSIFASSITTSNAYKEQLESLKDKSAKDKYEALAIQDIKTAAIALRECYDNANDGYISIEVDPFLSNDSDATVAEGKRLFKAINEPNVMIKVPATEAGYDAMGRLIEMGISVNATLIFSPTQAQKCLDVMTNSIGKYTNIGGGRVESVISVFVSRFDRILDDKLKTLNLDVAKVGIMNAAKIYNMIEKNHTPAIKTLFASTGVKGDSLEADYYIKELIAKHSINTTPLNTMKSYIDSGALVKEKLPFDEDKINDYFQELEDSGIDMQEIYDKLFNDGLKAFEESFENMLESIK